MRQSPMRRSMRGASLIEAMVATVVVAVATASVTNLLKFVGDASRRMTFQTASLDVYAETVAQIQDARCNVDPLGVFDRDPGLDFLLSNAGVWQTNPALLGASLIRRLGDVRATDANARSIPLNVSIRAAVANPVFAFATTVGPPAYDFEIRIREITSDPARDNPAVTDGYWIRDFPAKKVCNFRTDGTSRGETY